MKAKLGKFELPESPGPYVRTRLAMQGIRSLPITQDHSLGVYDLPWHHSDPVDRLIIAQAIAERMTVLTADRAFEKYSVNVLWCGR